MIRKVYTDINNSADENLILLKIAEREILKEYPGAEIKVSCEYYTMHTHGDLGAFADCFIGLVYELEF